MLLIWNIDLFADSVIVHRAEGSSAEQRCKDLTGQHVNGHDSALAGGDIGRQRARQTEKTRATRHRESRECLPLIIHNDHRVYPCNPELRAKLIVRTDSRRSKPGDRFCNLESL